MKDQSRAKFEFRIFSREPGPREERIRSIAPVIKTLESKEMYLLSGSNDSSNVKIRDGRMDIKELLMIEAGLEQWLRVLKTPFPLGADVIKDKVYPALRTPPLHLERDAYSSRQFFSEVLSPDRNIVTVEVSKKRSLFSLGSCQMEFSEVLIEGSPFTTIAVVCREVVPLLEAIGMLGYAAPENVNYVKALKEIKGLCS
jgi:hypothetical protein